MNTRTGLLAVGALASLVGIAAADEPGATEVSIHFEFDEAELTAESTGALDQIYEWMTEHPKRRLIIVGHADPVGTETYNLDLGLQRAEASKQYLVGRGIDPDRIVIKSKGETELVSNADALNRRAEFEAAGLEVRTVRLGERARPAKVAVPEVAADPEPDYTATVSEPVARDSRLLALSVGGGLVGFTDDSTRDYADEGGTWDVRVTLGARSPLAAELAYVGAAHEIDALGLDDDTALLGSSIEGGLRAQLPMDLPVSPYVFGGVGYTRYSLVGDNFNTSSVRESDNVVTFPVGLGAGVPVTETLLFDVRGTWRYAIDEDLLADGLDDEQNPEDSDLDNWSATARLGWMF